ncbi:MAG: 16S RNA G1207 methylase RsmC [Chloroflexota bacterium]
MSDAPAWRAEVEAYRRDLEVRATLRGREFAFTTAWGLFSPREVDLGTLELIEELRVAETDDCFDLGCGYGPVALTLAHLAPKGETWAVDRDFLAVEYTRWNAEANGLRNVTALLSNGFSAVPADRRFDVVATNLPAKVGNELTTLLFADAYLHLRPGGRLYVVTLSGMRKFIQRTLTDLFGNYEKVHQGRQHTVHLAVREG